MWRVKCCTGSQIISVGKAIGVWGWGWWLELEGGWFSVLLECCLNRWTSLKVLSRDMKLIVFKLRPVTSLTHRFGNHPGELCRPRSFPSPKPSVGCHHLRFTKAKWEHVEGPANSRKEGALKVLLLAVQTNNHTGWWWKLASQFDPNFRSKKQVKTCRQKSRLLDFDLGGCLKRPSSCAGRWGVLAAHHTHCLKMS